VNFQSSPYFQGGLSKFSQKGHKKVKETRFGTSFILASLFSWTSLLHLFLPFCCASCDWAFSVVKIWASIFHPRACVSTKVWKPQPNSNLNATNSNLTVTFTYNTILSQCFRSQSNPVQVTFVARSTSRGPSSQEQIQEARKIRLDSLTHSSVNAPWIAIKLPILFFSVSVPYTKDYLTSAKILSSIPPVRNQHLPMFFETLTRCRWHLTL